MIDFNSRSIKTLKKAFFKNENFKNLKNLKNLNSEKNYGNEIAEIFGAKPKGRAPSDDNASRCGKIEDIISAVKADVCRRDVFTEKQKETVDMFKRGEMRRINILDGSVRSGKTYISLILWALMLATRDYDERFIMVGRTLTTLKRNCLELLQELIGSDSFKFSVSRKEAELFGRRIYLEGADNALSEDKIRGMTLSGAYCDEITLLDEDFFRMLLSRLSVENAFLLGTTNPDNPTHWLMRDYLNNKKIDLLRIGYLIDDNTFLAKDYVSKIKAEYTGVFYDRFIRGMWKAAEGVVYPLFANAPERYTAESINPKDIIFTVMGVDFGGHRSANAFVLNGFTKNFEKVITLDEWYEKREISPAELEDAFSAFVRRAKKKYKLYEVYADSAESTLIKGLEAKAIADGLGVSVIKARKGPIVDRIRFYNKLMSTGRYCVLSHCRHITEAYRTAEWNKKALKDERLDDGTFNIDSLDACEYSTEAYQDAIEAAGVKAAGAAAREKRARGGPELNGGDRIDG